MRRSFWQGLLLGGAGVALGANAAVATTLQDLVRLKGHERNTLSETSQFVFGVDLDGVVADYTAGFAAFVASLRGIDPASLPEERSYDFREWDLSPSDFERYHGSAVTEHRMLAKLPAIEGAAEALWRLSDAGVWIRVITHRLYVNWGHAEAVADTVQWLDAERIPYRDICFLGNKPEVTYILQPLLV